MANAKSQKSKQEQGLSGEKLAAKLLSESGHLILARNFRIRTGEIDIISLKEDVLHFIEVKHWSSQDYIHPLEIFTFHKIRRMRKAAEYYLAEHVSFRNYSVSFCLAFINEKRELTFYLDLF